MLRRTFLRRSGFLGLAMLATPAVGRAQAHGDLRFQVFRDDSEIGHHALSFAQDGDRLTVDIDIALKVRFAFITAYAYEHRNREEWDGGRLLGFASRTNDNGTEHRVEARREGERLVIDGDAGRVTAPPGALPATYWHRRLLDQPAWVNTQTGRMIEGHVASRGRERLALMDQMVEAQRFRVTGDIELDLWYAGERWVKLAFDGPDGSRIDYRLVEDEAYRWLAHVPGVTSGS